MQLPSDRQIINTARAIDEHPIMDNAQMLRVFVKRARKSGSPQADGHRTSTVAAGSGGGPSVIVDDERVAVTGVEAAVISRTESRPRRDELGDAILRAWAHLQSALTALDNFTVALGAVSNVQADPVDNDAKCWVMARVGVTEKAERRIVVDNDVRQCGRWAADFHKVTGRIPTIEECMIRKTGKYVKRIDPQTGQDVGGTLPADSPYLPAEPSDAP